MRRAPVVLLALSLAACGGAPEWGPFPVEDHAVRWDAPETPVELGVGFPLTIERVHPAGAEVGEVAAPAPLELVELGMDRRERDGRVQERLRYRAHAFRTGELDVPGPAFRIGGDDGRLVVGDDLRLVVRSALPEDDAGALEPPAGPLRVSPRRWPLVAGGAVVLALLIAARLRRREAVGAPSEAPEVVVIRELDALASTEGLDRESFHARLAGALRRYLGAVGRLDPSPRSTEELLADGRVAEDVRAGLASVLIATDLARFAGPRAAEPDRDELLRRARAVVAEAER